MLNDRQTPKSDFNVLDGIVHATIVFSGIGGSCNWNKLEPPECPILHGQKFGEQRNGAWAELGWVRGSGAYVFNPVHAHMPEVRKLRATIKKQVLLSRLTCINNILSR